CLADADRAGALAPRDAGCVFLRHIGEGGADGGGRQSRDVDIVLDRNGHAVERRLGDGAIGAALPGKRLRLGHRVRLFPQRNEYRWVVMRANPRVSARHGPLDPRRPAPPPPARRAHPTPPPPPPPTPPPLFFSPVGFEKSGARPSGPPPPPFGGGGGGGGHTGANLVACPPPYPSSRSRIYPTSA